MKRRHPSPAGWIPVGFVLMLAACADGAPTGSAAVDPRPSTDEEPAMAVTENETPTSEGATPAAPATELATFGAGCFWCVEAVLEQLDGVEDVRSGYMGGTVDDPTYREVCSGTSGHAEVVQVQFDPSKIGYDELLSWFWRLHDPTTLNRQGGDVGTQYRSAIYYHSDEQRETAEKSREAAGESFEDPVVTEVTKAGEFFEAEGYHQGYYQDNREQSYCQVVIKPKLKKLGLEE